MKRTGRSHLSAREEAGSGCQPDREGKGAGLPARGEKRREWAEQKWEGSEAGLAVGLAGEEREDRARLRERERAAGPERGRGESFLFPFSIFFSYVKPQFKCEPIRFQIYFSK